MISSTAVQSEMDGSGLAWQLDVDGSVSSSAFLIHTAFLPRKHGRRRNFAARLLSPLRLSVIAAPRLFFSFSRTHRIFQREETQSRGLTNLKNSARAHGPSRCAPTSTQHSLSCSRTTIKSGSHCRLERSAYNALSPASKIVGQLECVRSDETVAMFQSTSTSEPALLLSILPPST